VHNGPYPDDVAGEQVLWSRICFGQETERQKASPAARLISQRPQGADDRKSKARRPRNGIRLVTRATNPRGEFHDGRRRSRRVSVELGFRRKGRFGQLLATSVDHPVKEIEGQAMPAGRFRQRAAYGRIQMPSGCYSVDLVAPPSEPHLSRQGFSDRFAHARHFNVECIKRHEVRPDPDGRKKGGGHAIWIAFGHRLFNVV
jgi:hypothetical protein